MAMTERYASLGLTTGANDGTSETDAWRTWSDINTGIATEIAAGRSPRVNVKVNGGGTHTLSGNFTLTISATASATRPVVIRGYTTTIGDGDRCLIDCSTFLFDSGTNAKAILFQDFEFTGSRTAGIFTWIGKQGLIYRCKFHQTNTAGNIAVFANCSVMNCYFKTDRTSGGNTLQGSGYNSLAFIGNTVDLTATTAGVPKGLFLPFGSGASCAVIDNKFLGGGIGYGVELSSADTADRTIVLHRNSFHDFSSPIRISDMPDLNDPTALLISDNVFYGATAWGVENVDAGTVDTTCFGVGNAFGNTTSGDWEFGDNEHIGTISLTADPYIDASSDDLRLNNTAGGGRLARAAALPTDIDLDGTTDNYGDVGAMQAKNMIRRLHMAGGGMK